MLLFLGGILFLLVGYFLYGRLVEKIVGPDSRETPSQKRPDGVDYVPLPRWKNLLIQLLNIAGIGPVIGVIVGIKFGKIALLIIPIGCVFMGAVHDFVIGMMSLRSYGSNLPRLIQRTLGKPFARFFSAISVLILLLVVTVFINVPANLVDKNWLPSVSFFWWAVAIIFAYYVAATLFSVDKIIGTIYPIFGALLIVGSFAIFLALIFAYGKNPELFTETPAFIAFHDSVFNVNGRSPIFPLLFVTIACGIISGFHATQSPIVARTMTRECDARMTFYGMMIAEGVIAMIWAMAALVIYNLDPSQLSANATSVLGKITSHFLGSWMGGVTVLAVVVLAITSGDTALRSCRLSLAEIFSFSQKSFLNRFLITLPLIFIVVILLAWSNANAESFNHLWNYFAWGNQFMAATALTAGTVWLMRRGHRIGALVTFLPALFMITVVASFILWTSSARNQPWGFGLPLWLSNTIGFAIALIFAFLMIRAGIRHSKTNEASANKLEKKEN